MSENTTNTTTNTEQSIEQNGIPEITFEIESTTTVTQPTDPSLRNEGQPADAAAVGDALGNVEIEIAGLDTRLEAAETALSPTNTSGVVYRTDIETTLVTAGKVADSKATGDAISAAATTAHNEVAAETLAREGAITELTSSVNTQIQTGLDSIPSAMFPVGAIYMTTLAAVPAGLPGVWTEIVLPLTWQNINTGTRGYAVAGETTPARTVHFFLRTE